MKPPRGHRLGIVHRFNFLGIAQLNFNVFACGTGQIDRRGRPQGIERNVKVLCQNCQPGCSDFIGDIAIFCHAIKTDQTGAYPAVFHHGGRHAVADERHLDARAIEFPRCQPRPLQQGRVSSAKT